MIESAFPVIVPNEVEQWESGMTLRDYFAGQALAGPCRQMEDAEAIAKVAYQIADAMLKERKHK